MSGTFTPAHRATLSPFATVYLAMADQIDTLDLDELIALKAACESTDTTNCGWFEYEVARALAPMINREIAHRRMQSAPTPSSTGQAPEGD
jgi:hypothetical protein